MNVTCTLAWNSS